MAREVGVMYEGLGMRHVWRAMCGLMYEKFAFGFGKNTRILGSNVPLMSRYTPLHTLVICVPT